ncbi:MAG: DUF4476 domain-containing protein, partial [Pseudomonadota bacterium]|nr:DUF4476 domain-containing protein [Pseudomonadota bacterium]
VDGRVIANRPGERGATAIELAGGNHRVQVFDPQDRLVTSATVSVIVSEQARFELRRGQLTELGRGPLASQGAPCTPVPPTKPAPAVIVVKPPPPVTPVAPVAPVGPLAMRDGDFTGFISAVKAEAFSSDQLGIITGVARTQHFTIAQVGVVLDQLAHSSDKVAAATVLAPRVIDRENAWKLNEHLTFSSDKDAVRALFQ